MSDQWPGRVVADHPNNAWPGKPLSPERVRALEAGSVLSDPAAVDGDTIRADEGRVRLFGVDAPELTQPGYDRQGNPVPIGQQSRDYLNERLGDAGTINLGPVAGTSYGRTVAPITLDGQDAGIASVRSGNALAAPSYVSDEAYRFKLLEAERLARQNGLGPMNDTLAQRPADYRAAPVQPTSETVAMFWDTPTPFAGMTPEAEQQYRELQANGTAEEMLAFTRANGLDIGDIERLRWWVNDRDERKAKGLPYINAINYERGPPIMEQKGDGAIGAGGRGVSEGFLAGGVAEAGAIIDTFGGTAGRENVWNSDRRLADIWDNNHFQNEAIRRGDEYAHPTANTVGEVGGALTSGFLIPYGAGARTVPALARVGAVYGGVEGFLGTEGAIPQRLQGAVIGAPIGAAVNAVGGKAIQVAAPVVARGVEALRGRFRGTPSHAAIAAAETSGEAGVDYAGGSAQGAAQEWPGRVVDRIDIGTLPLRDPMIPSAPIDTAYPGPVQGKSPLLSDVMPELESWAARQGEGVMLHGSKTPDIDAFDPYGKSGYGLFGQGTYLTDNPAVAAGYSAKGLRGGDPSGRTIYAAEQRVRNPLDMDAPADIAAWQRVAGDEADFSPGMTNAEAYRALEEALADDSLPMWEGAERMADAVRALGHDGITHVGGGRFGKGEGPEHRVVIALDPEQTVIRDSFPLGQRLQPTMRDRDWIDIAQVPASEAQQWPGRVVDPRTIGMDAEPMPSVSGFPRPGAFGDRPRPLLDPATEAERAAAASRVQPGDVLPLPSNTVDGVEDAAAAQAGRYVEAKPPNERAELSRGTVRNYMGVPVPKVGPTDLVGWLRLRGGLRDSGGELAAMGLTNAARRGMDFVGQEARFGPLVNEQGSTLDDAALAAWEDGYFPELTERPTINEFLDAIRDTYHGGAGRRFNVDDFAEIERFEALQAERYDLEQRRFETGEPVWQDRSVDADDAAPFPPVEAYEEWPSDAIKRVGNVDVTKLDTPQDIRRALKQTCGAAGGFDAATRGRVTQAETERLAADLNMTPEQLLSRRQGQAFNAEEALAARQILAKSGNELVNLARRVKALENPGDELLAEFRRAWMRHAAIQEQVAGATAEAGRSLGQFRMAANSRAVRGEVLAAFVKGGGGQDRLQDAAATLLEAVEMGPGKFNAMVEKATKPKFKDKLAELYINYLLSWPQTHIVNITSNTLTSIAQIPEHAVGAALGGARAMLPGNRSVPIDRVTATEVGARAFGLLQGVREGARMFSDALGVAPGYRAARAELRGGGSTRQAMGSFRKAFSEAGPSDEVSKVEGEQYKAITGLKGEVVRLPTRFLSAEDEFFKGIARRMELNAQAVRITHREGLKGEAAKARIAELMADPTDDMLQRSLEYGRYLTFQRKLGPFAQDVSNAANRHLIAKVFLPFVRTPTNLLKFATERSPAAPLLKEWRADFAAGGARRDMAVARAMVGTGFGYALYQAAAEGLITGSAPSDPKKAKLLYADGWKPYSVKINGTYYSYKRLDPFSTTIGVAADLATLPEGMSEKQREDKTTLLVASIMGNLASKTWMTGLSDFVSALAEPERHAGNLKNRVVASFLLPNAVGGTARTMDPVARETGTLSEELQARLPGLRDDLLPQRDIWGRVIKNEGGLGPDAFSPIWISRELADPVNHELMQLDYAPGVPRKEVGGRTLTPVEYDRYLELSGKGAHATLSTLVRSPEWRAMDDPARVKAAKKAVKDARAAARDRLFAGGASDDDDGDDDWPGKPITPGDGGGWPGAPAGGGEQWPGKPVASRDVMGDLQRLIPGVRFTSGFRDPAYNASLRARGYNPADNSEHLDGSALDMLPPPGKSLGWLMREVKRYDPAARLLVHDGHLHAGFNGFYNAPKLGGMVGR